MARTVRFSAVLATLIMEVSALQLSPEVAPQLAVDERMCGKEQTPYEAFNPMYPDVCSVYCVPAGTCEGQAQSGKLQYLGITGQGTCHKKGYTQSASLGSVSQETVEWLKYLQGPCKGMTFSKFQFPEQKPAVAEQKMFVDGGMCGKGQTSWEAITPMYPDVCSVFCVPDGECLGQAQHGDLKYLGIVGEGNCKKKGYTEEASLGPVTQSTSKWLDNLQGACKGMKFTKFKFPEQKPAEVEQKMFVDGGMCGKGQTSWEAITPMYPDVCSVFCVPDGACLGQAQSGDLKYLGIVGEGNCKKKGYTEEASLGPVTQSTSKWLENLQGACQGMTFTKFKFPEQKPPEVEQKMFVDGGICRKEETPYEAISPMYPDVCSVFCVPEGECLGQAQNGDLEFLGVVGEGNCKKKGYTEEASLGPVTQSTSKWLEHLHGPCKGMTLKKFKFPEQKPPEVEQKMFVGGGMCGKGQTSWEAITPMYPDVCSVFCVPEGACLGQAQSGDLKYLGITGEGNCKKKGYTEEASLGPVTQSTSKWLENLQGPCKGMTFTKFKFPEQKPSEGEQ